MSTRQNLMAPMVVFCALAGRGWAIAPLEPDFPMIGGSLGQTIQLNIRSDGDPQIFTPRCQATLIFRDSRPARRACPRVEERGFPGLRQRQISADQRFFNAFERAGHRRPAGHKEEK